MQEIHPTLIKFLELLEDQLEDELSFQDSIYGITEEKIRKELRTTKKKLPEGRFMLRARIFLLS